MDSPGKNIHDMGTKNNKLKNRMYTLIYFSLKKGFSALARLAFERQLFAVGPPCVLQTASQLP